MTIDEQVKVLELMLAALKKAKIKAGMDPLNRPVLIVEDKDGREWWVTTQEVRKTNLLKEK